jgi:hypothetical protein
MNLNIENKNNTRFWLNNIDFRLVIEKYAKIIGKIILFIIVIGMKRKTKKLSLNKHSIFIIL